MSPSSAQVASVKAHAIDDETRSVLDSVARKNSTALKWFIISWTILFSLGVFGIYKQNQIAGQNKAHIDCIVKLFTAPNRASKVITNSTSTCNIVETNSVR